MNKMYEYLEEHNYISRNENKDPFRQQELSKERATAIACKCKNIIEESKQDLIKYLDYKINSLCSELTENSLSMNTMYDDEIRAKLNIYQEILDKAKGE